jgi:hypothetical protein
MKRGAKKKPKNKALSTTTFVRTKISTKKNLKALAKVLNYSSISHLTRSLYLKFIEKNKDLINKL